MSKKSDSRPYINTIKNSHWFLFLFSATLAGSFYWQIPSIFVFVIGSIIGIYCFAIHSIAWRFQNEFIRLFLFFIPAIVYVSKYEVYGLQTLLWGFVVAMAIWTIFRKNALLYVVGRT